MLASYPLLLVFLAACRAQSAPPQIFQDQWADLADGPQSYYNAYGPSAGPDMWPEGSTGVTDEVTEGVQSTTVSTQPPHTMALDSSGAVEQSAVWKIALVVAVLLVSVVGSLSLAYYLCFWRGGRIYYQPQKESET